MRQITTLMPAKKTECLFFVGERTGPLIFALDQAGADIRAWNEAAGAWNLSNKSQTMACQHNGAPVSEPAR